MWRVARPRARARQHFSIFAAVTHPAFIAHEQKRTDAEVPSVDKSTSHEVTKLVRGELFDPTDNVNKESNVLTAAAIEVWCKGMLHTLLEGQGARYITGGEYGIDKQTEEMKKHMLHTYRNTDVPCESYFGLLKYFKEKFTNLSTANADAMAHAKRNGLFSVLAPLVLARRKLNRERRGERPKKMKVARRGQLMMIDGRLRAVMMTSARRGVATAKARQAADATAAAERALDKREEAITKRLEQQVAQFARATAAFNIRPLVNLAALDAFLTQCRSAAAKTACMKGQIKRLVDGCGLEQFKVKYTSATDAAIGLEGSAENVQHLRRSLARAYAAIESEAIELPDAPVMPMLKRRVVPKERRTRPNYLSHLKYEIQYLILSREPNPYAK